MACTCDYCSKPAELVGGDVIYPHRPDLADKKFWLCRFCDAYVGCHRSGAWTEAGISDGTMPLGRLANAELRLAKSQAHAAFDPLWRKGVLSRSAAYAWLSRELGVPKNKCHIGMFDTQTCRRVVQLCGEY